jgi:RNA polymerase sigma-70 factor (ECF subfamily)
VPRAEPEDAELVARFLCDRSPAAFHALYARHAGGLFRFALRLAGGDAPLAEELAQEAWVRGIEGLPRFAFRSSLRTWLLGCVLNCWREHRRRSARTGPLPLPEPAAPARLPWLALDLERAIAALAPGQREVLLLHDVEGYSHTEVARMLEIDAGTSRSQLLRARRAVRQGLGAGEDEDHGRRRTRA